MSNLEIKGRRIIIRDLELENVYEMREWGEHENPLLEDYNFPSMSNREISIWYKMKVNNLSDRKSVV